MYLDAEPDCGAALGPGFLIFFQVDCPPRGRTEPKKRGLFKDLDPDNLIFEPQQPVIKEIQREDEVIEVVFTPPEKPILEKPVLFDDSRLDGIKDDIEREIAILMKQRELELFELRAAKQAEIEAEHKRKLSLMIILLLEEC